MDSELVQLQKIGDSGGRNPIQESRYQELKSQQGSYSGSNGIDYAGQRKIALEAVQPAITSLQASVPEISAKFTNAQTQVGAEKQPLKDRYDQLLNEIRGRETSQVNDTTKTANREFARRGITADSTFAAEETAGRTAPIRAGAQSDILTTTFDRESKLREIDNTISTLSTDMITAERDVRNTIAQIQATAGTDAANRAIELYKAQQLQKQQELDRVLTARQVAAGETTANAAANKTTQVDLGNRIAILDASGREVGSFAKGKTPSSGTDGNGVTLSTTTLDELQKAQGGIGNSGTGSTGGDTTPFKSDTATTSMSGGLYNPYNVSSSATMAPYQPKPAPQNYTLNYNPAPKSAISNLFNL